MLKDMIELAIDITFFVFFSIVAVLAVATAIYTISYLIHL